MQVPCRRSRRRPPGEGTASCPAATPAPAHIEALFGRVYGGRMVEGYDMMVEGYDVMALGSKCSGSGKP